MRICILGSSGSGKSTLARDLHEKLNIPVVHLDKMFWHDNWVESDKAEFNERVKKYVSTHDEWIIDGNYSRTWDYRLPQATHIILLQRSSLGNLYRVLKRRIKYHGKTRPDMHEGCKERIDFEFLVWTLMYKRRNKEKHQFLKDNYNEKLLVIDDSKKVDEIIEWIKLTNK